MRYEVGVYWPNTSTGVVAPTYDSEARNFISQLSRQWIRLTCATTSSSRRVTVPLVCKAWAEAITPSKTTSKLWETVEIHDLHCRGLSAQECRANNGVMLQSTKHARLAEAISRWLHQRCNLMSRLTVFPVTVMESSAQARSLALWSSAFGQALPTLASSSKLVQLTIHGPGVHAATGPGTFSRPSHGYSDPNAAGAILRGAFSLSSLHELHVYDVPWAESLHAAIVPGSALAPNMAFAVTAAATFTPTPPPGLPSHLTLTNLRELVINRSFYQQGNDSLDDSVVLDGGAVEAWAMLGTAMKDLPLLERLDLAHTHALTYCDPARGVAAAPWPPLQKLLQLSLAHDLSVQPPPPPPSAPAAGGASVPSQPPRRSHGSIRADGLWTSPEVYNTSVTGNTTIVTGAANDSDGTAVAAADACDLSNDEGDGDFRETFEDEALESEAAAPPAATEGVSVFRQPMLTVDAAYALVELHSWLPGCTALASLDLRNCGLEAVPLAVAHLPMLTKLDLYGNPLVTMRMPDPLRSLVWLRFSLDPCYDMLYEMMAAEGGEELAAEDMWTVELPAPQLQELEVDSSSLRALELIREAASGLSQLRRLVLVDKSADTLLF
ncbi:hypothetical protein Vretimale_19435 [Volvox reticuliferus]|uniref:Uncharacterized protein n=1 Tax=Volvox reticuliferus TaxID=1737510 RepID=A0A8J4FZB5_9CHLO|nr:hypothetical protein Vretifemale_20193 [Volvox reticuliferus]GIM16854.1 hypothetical protein Vretimale_19435 [Volvox reticuliferus]